MDRERRVSASCCGSAPGTAGNAARHAHPAGAGPAQPREPALPLNDSCRPRHIPSLWAGMGERAIGPSRGDGCLAAFDFLPAREPCASAGAAQTRVAPNHRCGSNFRYIAASVFRGDPHSAGRSGEIPWLALLHWRHSLWLPHSHCGSRVPGRRSGQRRCIQGPRENAVRSDECFPQKQTRPARTPARSCGGKNPRPHR